MIDFYSIDPAICPSSIDPNDDNAPQPIPSDDNAHKWDNTENPATCSECGTTKE